MADGQKSPEDQQVKEVLEQIEIQELNGCVSTQAVWPMAIALANKSDALDGTVS